MDYIDIEYEPSVADVILEQAAAAMKKAITSNVQAEIDALIVENDKLEKRVLHLEHLLKEYVQRESELDNREKELKRLAKRMSVKEFMGQREVFMYSASLEYVLGPKCDKCNHNRQISYQSPSGRDLAESCACAQRLATYMPKKQVLYEMRKNRDRLLVWYRPLREYDGFSRGSVFAEHVYTEGEDYKEFPPNKNVFFADKGQCQAYCDWLNNKE